MKKYIWIGKYESDIIDDLFFDSITIYGENKNGNVAYLENNNSFNYEGFLDFIIKNLRNKINTDDEIYILFHDYNWYSDINKMTTEFSDKVLLPCSLMDLEFLNNKLYSRIWLSSVCDTIPFVTLTSAECDYESLHNYFSEYNEYVVQKQISEGGYGTFIINKEHTEINDSLNDSQNVFIASPNFKPSISLNATILFFENNYIVFPISRQIVDSNYKYCGSDFISGTETYNEYKEQIDSFLEIVSKKILSLNYKGICGVDFIIYNDRVYFVEINPRFQGSTYVINHYLKTKMNCTIYNLQLKSLMKETVSLSPKDDAQINMVIYNHRHIINKPNSSLSVIIDGHKNIYQRTITNKKYKFDDYFVSSNDYYNYFADKYKYILPDYTELINNEGIIIEKILKEFINTKNIEILDCTCGIGIQTISLARLGYRVFGSDISFKEIEVAKKETELEKLNVTYEIADCMNLKQVFGLHQFDAIISMDSALPHLLTKQNFVKMFNSVLNQLKDGGVFLASFRDYNNMLIEKPDWAYPQRIKKFPNKDIIIVRNFEWDHHICISHQYYIERNKTNNCIKTYYNTYKQWAITKDEIFSMLTEIKAAKFGWLLPCETGFYQPILFVIK